MCMISVVHQGAQQIPIDQWNRPAYNELQEILRLVRHLDETLGQPDCEDPQKAAWQREVEQRLTEIENRLPDPVE